MFIIIKSNFGFFMNWASKTKSLTRFLMKFIKTSG